jgi:hypothetical protein
VLRLSGVPQNPGGLPHQHTDGGLSFTAAAPIGTVNNIRAFDARV